MAAMGKNPSSYPQYFAIAELQLFEVEAVPATTAAPATTVAPAEEKGGSTGIIIAVEAFFVFRRKAK